MPGKNIVARAAGRLAGIFDARIRPALVRAAGRNGFLARAYYMLLSRAFLNEQHAVLSGIAEYSRNLSGAPVSDYLLRRNIHRLEKGLLMRPRKDVFALSYIGETVEAFCRAHAAHGETDEVLWAAETLRAYFDAVKKPQPALDELRRRFLSVYPHPKAEVVPQRPEPAPKAGYDELFSLMRNRKSVRWFRPDPVPRDVIDRAVAAAAFSPSACNRQPFEFRIMDEPDLVKQVAAAPMGTVGFAENIPAIAVVVGHLQAFFSERDRHLIYIDSSLAAMSFVLALEAQGIASCCINWPDLADREANLARILKLENYERPVMLIAMGYAAEEVRVARSVRKPVDQLRSYNIP